MNVQDDAQILARAEQAYAQNRLDEARRTLQPLIARPVGNPAALHLLGLVERKAGRSDVALQALQAAYRAAPFDVQIANNLGNLLAHLGRLEEALRLYDTALKAQSNFTDARLNRALILTRLERHTEALSELDRVASDPRLSVRAHSARGACLLALGRPVDAGRAYDQALALDPNHYPALAGRARAGLEAGERNASDRFAPALRQRPGDPDLVIGICEALEVEGDPLAIDLLTQTLAQRPEWVEGHRTLARMRSEAGHGDAYADHFRPAIAAHPANAALHLAYWDTLWTGERAADALSSLRAAPSEVRSTVAARLMEAGLTSELGENAEAARIVDGLAQDAPSRDLDILRAQIALRAGAPETVTELLEARAEAEPGDIGLWSLLGLAWRLLDDPRHRWLGEQQGLVSTQTIDLDASELGRLAELLRTIHTARAHPIGQSLRNGTQTRGALLHRREPELAQLSEALSAAVARYWATLPMQDPSHPLLRHADQPVEFAGSWSVRLTRGGFHVAHVHPRGIVSSACYIALDTALGEDADRSGWLELGRPPQHLRVPLEPLHTIKPEPGKLALFPSYMFHGTRPFEAGERLTVAFDLAPARSA